jgi:hypothetical protein
MSQPWIFGGLYFLLFLALVFGLAFWRRHQRRDRRPFPDQLKLLRGPGETQLKLVRQIEENSALHLCAALAAPLLASLALLWITTRLSGLPQLVWLGGSALVLVAALYFSARYLVAKLEESNNRYLGFFGERVVAEHLDPLKAQGFRVFHDVPCGDASAPFNIDHVVAGPSGVFAIETKTRRKGRSREGFAAHEIIYDGQVLAYPWGEDRHGLDQAARQARWLGDWLASLLGRRPPVQPILAFPGWMIIRRGTGTVTVLNPKEIPAAVTARGPVALDARELDLIARQLESRCRDVEF